MKPPSHPYRESLNSTASSLVANNFKISCVYCKGPHYSASCDKVREVKARKDILIKTGRCFNCLRTNHKTKECLSTKTCRICHKRHHQSICNSVSSQAEPFVPLAPAMAPQKSSATNDSITSDDSANSTECHASTNQDEKTVLLQTAFAIATDDETQKEAGVRILFDNGSQRSYVTENVCAKLRSRPIHSERLQVNTFGGQQFKVKQCKVVRFSLHRPGSSERLSLTAVSYPSICSNLPAFTGVHDYAHLAGLELADRSGCRGKDGGSIDVLIGSDNYWKFVMGEVRRGEQGPIAVQSKLGWLLSGSMDSSHWDELTHANLILTKECIPESHEPLQDVLCTFWETESIGITEFKKGVSERFLTQIRFQDS